MSRTPKNAMSEVAIELTLEEAEVLRDLCSSVCTHQPGTRYLMRQDDETATVTTFLAKVLTRRLMSAEIERKYAVSG